MDELIEDTAPFSNEEPAESLEQLTQRHSRELAEAYARAERAASMDAETLRTSVRLDAAEALVAALDNVRQVLATAREVGDPHSILVTVPPPGWLGRELEHAATAAGPGVRPVVVMVPGQTTTGWQEKRAWALVDNSDTAWR